MALPPLAPGDLSDLQPLNLHNRTPLWFYILREAQVTANGEHLGPVGGRIVAEVLYGLIEGDSLSYLGQDPQWTPTYGTNGAFTIVDLLTKSGTVATLTSARPRAARNRILRTAVQPRLTGAGAAEGASDGKPVGDRREEAGEPCRPGRSGHADHPDLHATAT